MAGFVGRRRELASLTKKLAVVESDSRGLAIAMRGRRQVGKSRLVEQFCRDSGRPYLYFQASRGVSNAESMVEFTAAMRTSELANATDIPETTTDGWLDLLRLLALALPHASPSVVVIDEIPWLMQQDARWEGHLQTAWDRHLSRKPVLLILIGSDLRMMEAFTGYDRPFCGRADQMVVQPLNPGEVAKMTGLTGGDALDASLITGGFPSLCRIWPDGLPAREFLAAQCAEATSPLFTQGEVMVGSEFPNPDQTRKVLTAIGHGERTFSNIAASAGSAPGSPVKGGTLSPILHTLQQKHAITAEEPLAVRRGNGGKLYYVADTYLRLYLAMLERAHEDVKRDRPKLALSRIERQWESWRGRAIEPLIREALERRADDLPWPEAAVVGSWWPRSFNPEIDIVGADRAPVARKISYVGSVKWLGSAFDRHDLAELIRGGRQVPGAEDPDPGLVVVSRSGVSDGVEADVIWGPDDVLAAWG